MRTRREKGRREEIESRQVRGAERRGEFRPDVVTGSLRPYTLVA